MRVKFKLEGEPNVVSVFEAGLISKELYKDQWVLTYANLTDSKHLYNIVTIIPMEFTADYYIEQALFKGYIDISDYKTVAAKELDNKDQVHTRNCYTCKNYNMEDEEEPCKTCIEEQSIKNKYPKYIQKE